LVSRRWLNQISAELLSIAKPLRRSGVLYQEMLRRSTASLRPAKVSSSLRELCRRTNSPERTARRHCDRLEKVGLIYRPRQRRTLIVAPVALIVAHVFTLGLKPDQLSGSRRLRRLRNALRRLCPEWRRASQRPLLAANAHLALRRWWAEHDE